MFGIEKFMYGIHGFSAESSLKNPDEMTREKKGKFLCSFLCIFVILNTYDDNISLITLYLPHPLRKVALL